MTPFTVINGGRSAGAPPPLPPSRPPVADLTENQIADAQRMVVYHLKRRPELFQFLHELVNVLDHDGASSADALSLIRGAWRGDPELANVLGSWLQLRPMFRRAIGQLAGSARPNHTPQYAITSALEAAMSAASPAEVIEIAGWMNGYAARVTRKRSKETTADVRTARSGSIANALPSLTDNEIAVLAPLVAAVADRGQHRASNLRTAVGRFLRRVFERDDWAKFGISVISVLHTGAQAGDSRQQCGNCARQDSES